MGWVKTVAAATLRTRGRAVFRLDGRQIALFDTPDGVFACNNRCPHQGYPLSEGTLDEDCRLTCNWHNWRFDLRSGENQRDGDRLRVYPVQLRAGDVWVEIVDPPPEQRLVKTLADLRQGFADHDYQRLARELARIQRLRGDATVAVKEAIRWSHDRLQFGWTHAFAGTADWLALHDGHEREAEDRLICLLEAIGHMADDTLREAAWPYAEGAEPWDAEAFHDAVEAQREERAIRLARGALAAPGGFAAMEDALGQAAMAHYADFGHAAIYVVKAGELLSRLGEEMAEPLLLPLVRSIVAAFREDLIPEFRGYRPALAAFVAGECRTAPPASAFAGLDAGKALALTARHGGAPPAALFGSLLAANATNMLAFDLRHLDDDDQPYGSDFGWLDLTHGLTFADAALQLARRQPALWPAALLQMACFTGRNSGRQDRAIDLDDWRVDDAEAFFARAEDMLFDHGRDEYIVSVHLLKTVQAVRRLLASPEAGGAGEIALAALHRLLASPIPRKKVRRTARQAMRFVAADI